MRVAEATNIAFFSFLILLAWMRPLPPNRRAQATAWGIAIISLVLGVQFLDRLLEPLPTAVIRDWLPAPLLLIAYWTAGRLFTSPNEKLQNRLARFDQKVFGSLKRYRTGAGVPRAIATCLEFAYMLCYSLVPFGIGDTLYRTHAALCRRVLDDCAVIGIPVLWSPSICPDSAAADAAGRGRTHSPDYKISANESLDPSPRQHSSKYLPQRPRRNGILGLACAASLAAGSGDGPFCWFSISIAVGAVLGRYHYAADAMIGAAVAIVVFLIHVIFC